ncbi:MAG: hypothetical protein K0S12_558 [Bacteroidetes bacterium]|nr:hypothetical protein [Bacteroidota bacterium]
MNKFVFLFLISFISLSLAGQGDKTKNAEAAEKTRLLYNEKKYSEIYSLFSPRLKNEMKEQEFCDFMNRSLFVLYGPIESLDYLKESRDCHAYISHFKHGDFQMNLGTDKDNHIDLISFTPILPSNMFKITNYLTDNKKENALDSLVDKVVKDHMQSPQNCGLSIGIIKNGKEIIYNYGEVKRNSKSLATPATLYEIGSVSKVFCGILLANAILEKKVNPDDDIRKYLPGEYPNLQAGDNYIQLIHLANHTSGLPRLPDDLEGQANYDPQNPYKNYDREMVFNFLKKVKLTVQPGKVSDYSNIGMGLLGIILERVYGKPFEELVKEKIAGPLGMKNTVIRLDAGKENLFATGYNAGGKETPHWELEALAAAGALRSDMQDMMIFLKENIEGKNEAVKLSHQSTFNSGSTVGMAWQLMKTRQGNTLIWHNGGTFGFSSFIGLVKEKNSGVVVLNNSGTNVDFIALQILKHLQQ